MTERPLGNDELDLLVGELADDFLRRRAAGEDPHPDEYAARHPEAAAEVRQALKDAGLLAAGAPPDLPAPAGVSGVLGDYRIVREVGRGGMGVVYEAEQLSLGRRVALKVLPFAALSDSRLLQRFKNEARAAAALDHPHVVKVFGVGQNRGVHYLAMQFIDGRPLSDLVRERNAAAAPTGAPPVLPDAPTVTNAAADSTPDTAPIARASTHRSRGDAAYFRRVAEWGVQAADALEHAHAMGVVHRDVKPGNLLLDHSGNVWVADFGLAKLAASDAGITGTGDVLGTLRYMAPEQALSKHDLVDHRADVYALGATLYELLTGVPAVDGTDKADILRKITQDEPAPPRKLDRSIPRDLETVVLKCLRKEPGERYPSAGEVATDLQRFLAGEPVWAKRPTLWQRAGKRVRRHPWVTLAAALALGLAVGGGVVWRQEQARADAAAGAVAQEAESLKAQERYTEALAVARRAQDLLPRYGARERRRQVTELARDLDFLCRVEEAQLDFGAVVRDDKFDSGPIAPRYYQAFLEYGVDVAGWDEAAVVRSLKDRAIRPEIRGALTELAAWAPDRAEKDRLFRIVDALDDDGGGLVARLRAAVRTNDPPAVRRLGQEAVALRSLPRTADLVAALLYDANAHDEAERVLRAAQADHPEAFQINNDLAELLEKEQPPKWADILPLRSAALAVRPHSPGAWLNYARALDGLGRHAEAEAALRQAIRLKPDYAGAHNNLGVELTTLRRWSEAEAVLREAVRLKPDYALAHNSLGVVLIDLGRWSEAEAALREAVRLKPDFAGAHNSLGAVLIDLGRWSEAEAALREAVRLKPEVAGHHYNLGNALKKSRRPSEAEAAYRTAIRLKADLAEAHDSLGDMLIDLGRLAEAERACREAVRLMPHDADAKYNLGRLLTAQGKLPEAEAAYREAVRLKPDYAKPHNNLGLVLTMLGRWSEAEAAFREAVRLKPDYAMAHSNRGWALTQLGRPAEAEAAFREAVRLNPNWAEVHSYLGIALGQQGKVPEAEACFRKAIDLKPDFAPAHFRLGLILAGRGELAEAKTAYREAIRLNPDDAESHCNLGQILGAQGQFAESLAAYRRGHELGTKQPGWPYPSAQWVRRAEALAALEARLPEVIAGRARPADAAQGLALAQMCLNKGSPVAAARLYAEAFTADPRAQVPVHLHRYNAARAAARAAAGAGEDATALSDAERARLRQQAHEWLAGELAAWKRVAVLPEARPVVWATMTHIERDPDLAGVRNPAVLAHLPPSERRDWERLWTDVAALRAGKPVAAPPREAGPAPREARPR